MALGMKRWIRVTILIIFIALLFVNKLTAEIKIPNKVEFKLENKELQFLPNSVIDVTKSPDGRLWLKLNISRSHKFSLVEIKKQISQEFHNKMPQLYGGLPVLFESNGRVWFIFNDRKTLVAYDGKEWIAQESNSNFGFLGRSRSSRHNSQNFEFKKIPFIIDRKGLYWYKDEQLHYQEFIKDKNESIWDCQYFVSQSANRLVIFLKSRGDNLIYEFKENKWEKVAVPETIDSRYAKMIPIGKDSLFFSGKESLLVREAKNLKAEEVGKLIQQLGADGFKIRKAATESLKEYQSKILPRLKEVLKVNKDPEITARLKEIIKEIERRAESSPMVVLGKLKLKQPYMQWVDRNKESYFFKVKEIHEGRQVHKNALLILKQDGTTNIVKLDSKAFNAISNHNGDKPIFSPEANGFWFGEPSGMGGLKFLDLHQGKLTDKVPIDQFYIPYTSTNDGALICNRYGHSFSVPLLAYHPGKPKSVTVINPIARISAKVNNNSNSIITDKHGIIWVHQNDDKKSVWFFDKKNRIFEENKDLSGYKHVLYAAGINSVLQQKKMKLFFFDGKSIVRTEGVLRDVLREHRQKLLSHTSLLHNAAYTTDGQWNLERQNLTFLKDGEWSRVNDNIKCPNGREFFPRFISPTPIKGKLFVTNGSLRHDGGSSFLLSWKNGELQKQPIPHCTDNKYLTHRVFDRQGNYWLPATIGRAASTCDVITGQMAVCLKKDGSLVQHKNIGVPVFCDLSNCIWLGHIRGDKSESSFNIMHHDKLVKKLNFPSISNKPAHIVSPSPGVVIIWDTFSMNLFTHPKDKPGEYSLKKQFFVNFQGDVLSMKTTADGNILLVTEYYQTTEVLVLSTDGLK